ncbi:peptidoglycan-binding protein [Rhodobacteraceae bacterium D3-12]|nr:peptidoglycan-binding protein [Rhodobacteraceae bacterium D3-12]
MTIKYLVAGLVSASFLTTTAPAPARADNNLAAGIVGAIVGGAIVNEAHKRKKYKKKRYYKSTKKPKAKMSSAQRTANREVQTSLNHFQWNVGRPDGVLGRNSRRGVSQYQAFMNFPVTGKLSELERSILVTSYQKAVLGGAGVAQLVSTSPHGLRALLLDTRNQMLGTMAAAPAPQQVQPAMQSEPQQQQAAAPAFSSQVASAAPVTTQPGLPTFAAPSAPQAVSLASHCAKISLVTSSNGGFVTEARMVDPNQALGEQFCLARGYAMDQGQAMAAKIQGFSPAQIAKQCSDFGALLKGQAAQLSTLPRAAIIQNVSGFIGGTGMSADQLMGTSKVCLSVGYRTDDMGVAIASALVLNALGQDAYGELLGHHLVSGIGTSERKDLAMDWYASAIQAVPVFAPGQPERSGLIQRAALMMNGHTVAPVAPVTQPEPVSATTGNGGATQGFASQGMSLLEGAQPAAD